MTEALHQSKLEDYEDTINLKIITIESKLKSLDSEWASYHDIEGEISMEDKLAITSKRIVLDTKLLDLLWFRDILKQLK
jgi:hypothetical protein